MSNPLCETVSDHKTKSKSVNQLLTQLYYFTTLLCLGRNVRIPHGLTCLAVLWFSSTCRDCRPSTALWRPLRRTVSALLWTCVERRRTWSSSELWSLACEFLSAASRPRPRQRLLHTTRDTLCRYVTYLLMWLVACHSGRTRVFYRRTFPVLRSTYSWRVTTYKGKGKCIYIARFL